MTETACVKKSQREFIEGLIANARSCEKRRHVRGERFSFFRPLSIKASNGRTYPAFSREISSLGIGLLHDRELNLGLVECQIAKSVDEPASKIALEIVWCEPCGDGWFISGGEFVEKMDGN